MSNDRIDWQHIAQENDKALLHAQKRNAKLVAACKLVLLFHSGSPWDAEKQQEWNNGMNALIDPYDGSVPTNEATTKNLCDAVRAALATDATTTP